MYPENFQQAFWNYSIRTGQILPLFVDVVADVEFSAEDIVSNSSGEADRLAIVWLVLGVCLYLVVAAAVFLWPKHPNLRLFVSPLAMFDIA